jgi:hypothetical protein
MVFSFFLENKIEGFDCLHVNEISFDVIFLVFFFRNDSNIAFRFYGALLNFPRYCIIALIKCKARGRGFRVVPKSYSEINNYRHFGNLKSCTVIFFLFLLNSKMSRQQYLMCVQSRYSSIVFFKKI